jgi:hypothetical protein
VCRCGWWMMSRSSGVIDILPDEGHEYIAAAAWRSRYEECAARKEPMTGSTTLLQNRFRARLTGSRDHQARFSFAGGPSQHTSSTAVDN